MNTYRNILHYPVDTGWLHGTTYLLIMAEGKMWHMSFYAVTCTLLSHDPNELERCRISSLHFGGYVHTSFESFIQGIRCVFCVVLIKLRNETSITEILMWDVYRFTCPLDIFWKNLTPSRLQLCCCSRLMLSLLLHSCKYIDLRFSEWFSYKSTTQSCAVLVKVLCATKLILQARLIRYCNSYIAQMITIRYASFNQPSGILYSHSLAATRRPSARCAARSIPICRSDPKTDQVEEW